MTELDRLADEIGISGRTLRRAAQRKTIRSQRRGHGAVVSADEYEYVRRYWPLLERTLQVLRTRTDVRLAVLFGSLARGDARPDSDVDLLVRVRGDWRDAAEAALALEAALHREVQFVGVEHAPPLLLADVLRDGRVL